MKDRNWITLKYSQTNNAAFMDALRRILNTPMNLKVAYGFKKIADEVQRVKKQVAKEFERDIVDKYVTKDEYGKPVMDLENEGFKVDPAKKDEFDKAVLEFDSRSVTIEREKVSLSFLLNFNLSLTPTELFGLEPILIDDMEGDSKASASA